MWGGVSKTDCVKTQIFYETKSGKTVSLEINLEETMQHVTEKIRYKEGIRPCNISFTKINTCCYFGNSARVSLRRYSHQPF